MLDRNKVAAQVAKLEGNLFRARRTLDWLDADCFAKLTQTVQFRQQLVRSGFEQYAQSLVSSSTTESIKHYTVLGVDGSQVYPDPHMQGLSCFLLNTGGCLLRYNTGDGSVVYFAQPTIVTQQHLVTNYNQRMVNPDFVDLMREEYELEQLVAQHDAHNDIDLILFDGNLLFWHLETKGPLKDTFFKRYIAYCQALYERRALHAGYLSATRFADLVSLFDQISTDPSVITLLGPSKIYALTSQTDFLTDGELLSRVLSVGQRTEPIRCSSNLMSLYPQHLQPCFFYLNVRTEIVRIEIPLWIAQNQDLITKIVSIALDQVEKGFGYPIALAEAHSRAVVTTADREFFFSLIMQKAAQHSYAVGLSPKSLKKRITPF